MIPKAINRVKESTAEGGECSLFVSGGERGLPGFQFYQEYPCILKPC